MSVYEWEFQTPDKFKKFPNNNRNSLMNLTIEIHKLVRWRISELENERMRFERLNVRLFDASLLGRRALGTCDVANL